MATYRFTLTTPEGSRTFGADQVSNWSDIKPSFVLNETYRGIFREFTSTFEFAFNARRTIIRAFDKYGYDVDIFLTIEVGNDNGEFSSFRQLAYRLRADIQEIEIGDLTVSLNFLDSGFVANIMNREDMEVNLELPDAGKIQSVDGDSVQAVDRLLWNTRLHDRRLIFNSLYNKPDETASASDSVADIGGGNYNKFFVFPLTYNYISDENFQNTFAAFVKTDGTQLGQSAFYLQSEKRRIIEFIVDIQGTMQFASSLDLTSVMAYRYGYVIRRADESTNDEFIFFNESEKYYGGEGDSVNDLGDDEFSLDFSMSLNESIEIEEGDSIELFFEIRTDELIAFDIAMQPDYSVLRIEATSLEIYPSTRADVILPHELFTQLLQVYTGQQTPFYSEFFGRKDLGYSENGPGSCVAVATGKMIRGFPYGEKQGDEKTETLFNTSFKDAFQAYNKIFNLAATIENIGREQRLRIEPMEYFQNFEILANLGDNISEISRTVNPDKIYSEIKVGYKNKEYEELNGLFSFNGEMRFSTPLQTEAESLQLINEWRADDIGIELTRRMQYADNPSEDYRSDEDIFFIDCQIFVSEISDDYYIYPKRGSNYDSVEGIFEPDWAYNLNLSPKRCFYNWQDEIKAGLAFKPNKSLKYIKGPKNPNLISKAPNELEIVESEDVLISSLKNAKFIPEMIQISEAPLTIDDWDNIKENRYGVIKFSHKGITLYGFIMDIEFDINKKTANFELLRANL